MVLKQLEKRLKQTGHVLPRMGFICKRVVHQYMTVYVHHIDVSVKCPLLKYKLHGDQCFYNHFNFSVYHIHPSTTIHTQYLAHLNNNTGVTCIKFRLINITVRNPWSLRQFICHVTVSQSEAKKLGQGMTVKPYGLSDAIACYATSEMQEGSPHIPKMFVDTCVATQTG